MIGTKEAFRHLGIVIGASSDSKTKEIPADVKEVIQKAKSKIQK